MGHRIRRLSVALGLSIGLALPMTGVATAQPATAVTTSIVGKWRVSGGIFRFYRSGKNFTDQVIKQRPGVICPNVNDKNKQIVVHLKKARVYTGTWKWFYSGTCKSAGLGPITITVASSGKTASVVANPPKNAGGSTETFRIRRIT